MKTIQKMRLHQIKEGKSNKHHSKLTQSQLGWHREESPIICKLNPRSLVRNQTQQETKKKKKKKKRKKQDKGREFTQKLTARDKDVLVSMWYFLNKLKPKEQPPLSLDEAFDLFCEGISDYGPFWDHVLGYWKASQESPDKILFLRYEDLKREPSVYLKRLAVFLGQPFTIEEEREDVAQKIAKFCSFENLSNLEINKCGVQQFNMEIAIENSNFFRKGQIGDGKNHLTNNMIEHIDHITKQKFNGSGLISDELLTS